MITGEVRQAGGVYFIGIDLAWGERKPTGIAVLDDTGALLMLTACRSDDEIVELLSPYTPGECLVAIDGPLIVKNKTGNRQAEADLNRDFAKFDAGAHPVNTSKAEIGEKPRGARLCELLGLDINPGSIGDRRGIEVYPHPATISLFRLGRTLKYKNKQGRDLEMLRGELQELMRRIAGLADAQPALDLGTPSSPWPAMVEAVEQATKKSELRIVEDQADAVLCAYVAMFATRSPELTTIYGNADTGYILTPSLPEGLLPSPRARRSDPAALEPAALDPAALDPAALEPAALDPAALEPAGDPAGTADPVDAPDAFVVQRAVQEYSAQLPVIAEAGDQFIDLVTGILDDAGINYLSITGRIKSPSSFAGKAARRLDGELQYADPLHDITDQIGVRVITYVHSDVAAVAELLHDQVVVKDDRDLGRETASQGRFGYASRHLLIAADAARESVPGYERLAGRVASVQIRTVLQHAWAEFEHDIRYKGTVPGEHASEFDRRFTLAAGLLELADREFSAIRDRLRADPAGPGDADEPDQLDQPDDDPRIDSRELAAFLAGQYPDAGWSRMDHYSWISGLLLELGVTSLAELSDVLRPVNGLDLNARMDYRYPPGAVRRLDDALLAGFEDRFVGLHGNAHRVPLLRTRLAKLREVL